MLLPLITDSVIRWLQENERERMTIIILSCAIFTIIVIYHERILGILLSLLLRILIWAGTIQVVGKRKSCLVKKEIDGQIIEDWNLRRDFWGLLKREFNNTSICRSILIPNDNERERQPSVKCLNVSLNSPSCGVSSILMSPFTSMHPTRYTKEDNKLYLLRLALRDLYFTGRISIQIIDECEALSSDTTNMDLDFSFRFEIITFYLFAQDVLFLPFKITRHIWNLVLDRMIRKGYVLTTNARQLDNASSKDVLETVQADGHHIVRKANLQYKLSLLSKLVRGVDVSGVKIQLGTITHETKTETETEGMISLCIGKLNTRLLDLPNLDGNELTTKVSVSSYSTQLKFLAHDNKNRENKYEAEASWVKNDALLIDMNVSCNDTSLQSSACITINRGESRTCSDIGSGEIEVFSSSMNISFLLSAMQDFYIPVLLKIKKIQMQNKNNTSCKDCKDQGVPGKKPQSLVIARISTAIGITFHLLDNSHLMAAENTGDQLNTYAFPLHRLKFSTKAIVNYDVTRGRNLNENECRATQNFHFIICDACIRQNSLSHITGGLHDIFVLDKSNICWTKHSILSISEIQNGAIPKEVVTNDKIKINVTETSTSITSSVSVELGNIFVNVDDPRKIDRILLTCRIFSPTKTKISNKKISGTYKQRQDQLRLHLRCGSIKMRLPFQISEEEYTNQRENSLVYFVKIGNIVADLVPHDSLKLKAMEVMLSLAFTPHTSLPLHKYYFEEAMVIPSEESDKASGNSIEGHFLNRESIMAMRSRRVKFGIVLLDLDLHVALPPYALSKEIDTTPHPEHYSPGSTVDISVKSIIADEHIGYCEDDDSVGQKTDFFHSSGTGNVSISRQTFVSMKSVTPEPVNETKTLLQSIRVETHGSAIQLIWSPILQWFIISGLEKSKDVVRHCASFIGHPKEVKKEKIQKRVQTNIHIGLNETVVDASIYLRGGSLVHILSHNVVIGISHNITDSWKKPNVQIDIGKTQVNLNKSPLPVITIDSFTLSMTTRLASDDDVTTYLGKEDGENVDNVVTGTDGKVLIDTFSIEVGEYVRVRLPPLLQLGQIIDDINPTRKATGEGLQCAGLAEPQIAMKKKYQLLDIFVSIPMLNAILLEDISDVISDKGITQTCTSLEAEYPKTRFGKSRCDKALLERSQLHFVGLVFTIKRNTPKATTQRLIRNLDEDKSRHYIYGPMVDGGEISLQIVHFVWVLHPLSMATPLVTIKNTKINGLLHLASLDPANEGMIGKRRYSVPVRCHHDTCKNSSIYPLERCVCLYGAELTSSGIPNKIYIDLSVSFKEVHSTFGPVVASAMPKLQSMIKRIIPKPPENESQCNEAKAKELGWWDNLRYQFHGNISFKMEQVSFRWLLDTVPKYDWSILVTSNNVLINHSTGMLELKMDNLMVSLPGSSYHMIEAGFYTETNFNRQSLLLVPNLRLMLTFKWQVLCSNMVRSTNHHSVYMQRNIDTEIRSSSSLPFDKFDYFRSRGVYLSLDISLDKNSEFATWVALRADVLPWITHKNPDLVQDNKREGEAIPKINGIQIGITAVGLKIAAWFDEDSVLSSKQTLGSNENESTDTEGICLTIPLLQYSFDSKKRKRIDLDGITKAGLFNIIEHHGNSKYDGQFECSAEYSSWQPKDGGTFSCLRNTLKNKPHHYFEKGNMNSFLPFECLELSSHQMESLDYVLIVDQINIFDQALEEIKNPPSSPLLPEYHPNDFSSTKCPGINEKVTPWTVLIAGMRLLWTLEIRESVNSIVTDLLFAINYMRVNLRGTPQLLNNPEDNTAMHDNLDKHNRPENKVAEENTGSNLANTQINIKDDAWVADESEESDHNIKHQYSIPREDKNSSECSSIHPESHLNYLLTRSSGSNKNLSAAISPPLRKMQDDKKERKISIEDFISTRSLFHHSDSLEKYLIPTFNLQLANPQIQLHSPSTGGSVILAMRGASIVGQKFLKLFARKDSLESDDLRAETLLRRTEFLYTLDRMEIYSLNGDIDVDLGLLWLRTKNDVEREPMVKEDVEYQQPQMRKAENDFGVDSSKLSDGCENIFPPDLELHETSDFIVPYPLKQIMHHCTFKTRQEFHRPPIDLTQEELAETIKRKMVESLSSIDSDQIESSRAIDHVEIIVDELSFELDSYQFSVTFDVIRNVLLEPPKPPRERYYRSAMKNHDNSNDSRKSDHFDNSNDNLASIMYTNMEKSLSKWDEQGENPKKMREKLRLQAKEIVDYLGEHYGRSSEPSIRRIEYTLSKAKWKMITPDYIGDVEIDFTGFKGLHEFTADGSVNSLLNLEDMRVASLKPGPESSEVIIKTALDVERSPCQRCGVKFDRASNELTSCVFHSGSFRRSGDLTPCWTCCGASNYDATGCMSRPHTGVERVLSISFDALPRKVDGMTIYKHIEANVYHGMRHTLVVQLTKSLTKAFTAYFLGDSSDTDHLDYSKNRRKNVSDTSSDTMETLSTLETGNFHKKVPLDDYENDDDIAAKKAVLFGKSHVPKERRTDASKSVFNEHDLVDKKNGSQQRKEMFLIQYWRVGEININFSITGFNRFVNTSNQNLFIPPFKKIYKIGPIDHLNGKLVAHVAKRLLFCGASMIGGKIFGKSPGKQGHLICDDDSDGLIEDEIVGDGSVDTSFRQKDMLLGQPTEKSKKKKKLFSGFRTKNLDSSQN